MKTNGEKKKKGTQKRPMGTLTPYENIEAYDMARIGMETNYIFIGNGDGRYNEQRDRLDGKLRT